MSFLLQELKNCDREAIPLVIHRFAIPLLNALGDIPRYKELQGLVPLDLVGCLKEQWFGFD